MRIDNISSHSTPPGSNGLTQDDKNTLIDLQSSYKIAEQDQNQNDMDWYKNLFLSQLGLYQKDGEITSRASDQIFHNFYALDSKQFAKFINNY